MKTLVIIPAYNEAESICEVCDGLKALNENLDLLVVNDGSADETAALCRKNGYPLLNLPVNLGLAQAVKAGMIYANLHGYDTAIQFDADGQHRPEFIKPLLEKLSEGYDIACGSRFLSKRKPPSLRMLGSLLISLAIKLTTGFHMTDPTSGLRAYNHRMIGIFAAEVNHPPEPDTLSYLIRKGARIAEVPVTMDERMTGESYLTAFKAPVYMLRMAVSILLVQFFRSGERLDQGEVRPS